MDNEKRYGICKCCGQRRMLTSVLAGTPGGGIWAGWICDWCYQELVRDPAKVADEDGGEAE